MRNRLINIVAVAFFLICALALIMINAIPSGNFIAAPAITIFIYVPLLCIHSVLVLFLFITKNIKKKYVLLFFCFLIASIYVYFFTTALF